MKEDKGEKQPRMPKLWEALLTLGLLVLTMAVGILYYHMDIYILMMMGVVTAIGMALYLGHSWASVERMMIQGVGRALQSIIILAMIGILVGIWMDAGVVPTMIYYGLHVLSPSFFLVAVVLICSITSLATGSSWGTVGTMGIALLGIALGLGVPLHITAGAILCGAYFGDKMSPLSDTTNLASAMAGTDVISHVKFMIFPTAITYGICLFFFGVVGMLNQTQQEMSLRGVSEILNEIDGLFVIHPILLLPPILVVIGVAKKLTAIPGLALGIVSGAVLGLWLQNGQCTLNTLAQAGRSGFFCDTGMESLDGLLSTGGWESMMNSIVLTILAMMFGGLMEGTHQLEVLVRRLTRLVKSPADLVVLTEATCVMSNLAMPEQYISIVVPGRMYEEEYHRMKLHPVTLSNALENSGTVTSALIPWNTCGVYVSETLNMSVAQYGPWAIFNWLMPLVNVVLAYMGLTVVDTNKVPLAYGEVREEP